MHRVTVVSEVEEKRVKIPYEPRPALESVIWQPVKSRRIDLLTVELHLRAKSQGKTTEFFTATGRKRPFPKRVLTLSRGQDANIDFVDHSTLVDCNGADGVAVTGSATTHPPPQAHIRQADFVRCAFGAHHDSSLCEYHTLHVTAHAVILLKHRL